MVKLYSKATDAYLGKIADAELQFLIDNLEEESLTDTDYYINRTVLDFLKEKGMNEDLAKLIDRAMGEASEVEIRYEKVS